MLIDQINLNYLRVFECVFRTRSMTVAAKELHLTQSGVSQHIRSLEEALGIRLFDRVKRKLVPTSIATSLFKKCNETLFGIEQALGQISGVGVDLGGVVHLGLPVEFGNNIVLPMLARFCKLHPRLNLVLHHGLGNDFVDPILNGSIDFAFIDGIQMDKRLTVHNVYNEVYTLCVAEDLLLKLGQPVVENRNFFESLDYVDYNVDELILRSWFHHHFGVGNWHLNVRIAVKNVRSVIRVINSQLAAGILPGHVVQRLEDEGFRFHQFKGCGMPLINRIGIAFLKERTHSAASRTAIQWLLHQFKTQLKLPGTNPSARTLGLS